MPASGPARQSFEPQRVDYLSPETGGNIGAVTGGFPLWKGVWTLGQAMSEERSNQWGAFLDRQRGAQKLFLGYDYARPLPKAYPLGFAGLERPDTTAFDGTAVTWSVTIDGEGDCQLTLTGLPVGFTLALRDYVGFLWEDYKRALVRATMAASADETGSLTVPVEPALPVLVPDDAVATLDHPSCLMRLITSETEAGEVDRRKVLPAKISGLQQLIP
jgi:hypothetical protein